MGCIINGLLFDDIKKNIIDISYQTSNPTEKQEIEDTLNHLVSIYGKKRKQLTHKQRASFIDVVRTLEEM